MDFLKSLPSKYCRICFEDKGQHLKPMSEEVRDNFYTITNVHLIKSDVYSNLICTNCNTKISDTRKFREELISNEEQLMNSLSKTPNFTFVDPQLCDVIKVESASSALKISDVRTVEDDKSTTDDEEPDNDDFPLLPTTSDGKVICPHCNNSFLQVYIQQHIERVHLGVKNFTCDRCGRKFYKYASIVSHINQHTGMQPFPCPKKCGMNFANKTTLRAHLKHVHSKENANYICEVCSKEFKEKYFLKEHILAIHEGFRFKCTFPDCNLEYTTSQGLRQHKLSTHDSKLVPCEICGEKYQSGTQLKSHKKFKHPTKSHACSYCDKTFISAAFKKTHEKLHTNQKDYVCTICNARYHIKRYLTRHIQVAHQKSKFFCKVEGCKAALCNKDNYRTHVKKVHQSMPPKEMEELLAAITLQKPDFLDEDGESLTTV